MDYQEKQSAAFNTSMDYQEKQSAAFNTSMDYQKKLSAPFNASMDYQKKQLLSDSKVRGKYIDDDLAFYVLSKLAIKSLKRFGCVRKSWSILLDNSGFINMYRNHFISHNDSDDDDTFLFIYQRDHDDREYAELHLLDSRIKLNLPPPFQDNNDLYLSILGKTSVNGIFCIGQYNVGGDSNKVKYVLWNPTTQEFFVIPPSPDELLPKHPLLYVLHKFHGFGYDQLRDDFKLIQYVSFDTSTWCDHYHDYPPIIYNPFFEIYSLRNNSWKILHIDHMSLSYVGDAFTGDELYTHGACHWLVKGKQHDTILVMSFDLSHEVFFTTPIDERSDLHYHYGRLAVLNGSIAFIINHHTNNIFHISILGELGVKESWIKLFICSPMPSIYWPPIGFGNKGYIFFRKKDDELAYVDLSTQIIEELGVKGEERCCKIGLYKESLVSIRGSSN